MRVLALTKYGARAASTRQRLLQFLPYLNEHGVKVEYLPLFGDDHLLRLAEGHKADPVKTLRAYINRLAQLVSRKDHDLLWIHYELFPYLPGVFERFARWSRVPIVCDFDDAIFHMYDDHRLPVVRKLLGHKLVPLLKSASACSCGNAYLLDYVSRYCDNSTIIPTVVDTQVYAPDTRTAGGEVRIGWIGTPSTWKYVEPLLPILKQVVEQTGAVIRTVGAGPGARGISFIEARDWEQDYEVREVQDMDIGIMPLPDEKWARGKCGYKLIQYMACAHPVVASPVGVNQDIVTNGKNGFLATTPAEWAEGLLQLIRTPELRTAMGRQGRSRVIDSYSLTSQAPRMLALLKTASATNTN